MRKRIVKSKITKKPMHTNHAPNIIVLLLEILCICNGYYLNTTSVTYIFRYLPMYNNVYFHIICLTSQF